MHTNPVSGAQQLVVSFHCFLLLMITNFLCQQNGGNGDPQPPGD